MTEAELIANLEAAAAKLCGQPVTVRIMKLPAKAGYKLWGVTHRDATGRAVIDLDREIFNGSNYIQFLETFPHEAAHVVKHLRDMPSRPININNDNLIEARRLLDSYPQAKQAEAINRREDEAEALAADWRAVIDRHYKSYIQVLKDPILTALTILFQKTS